MTAPNQWTSDQLATLQGYISPANTDLANKDLTGARAAITQYYTDQAAWGRGYVKLAAEVVTNTGFEGQVAVDALQNIAGSSVTPETETQLLVSLATSDNALLQGSGGLWPTMNQIEQYHFQDYQFVGLPVFAWGGAAFAYFDQNWGGGTLTGYEVGDGSHSALFQSMTAEQVQQNVDTLTYDGMLKIGIAAANADALFNSAPGALPQDALAALQGSIANNEPSLNDVTDGFQLAFKTLALVYGTALLTQAQVDQAATKAFTSSVDNFFRSGLQDVSGFLNAVGNFLGVNIGDASISATDLPSIAANFASNLPYLHVVRAGETYDTIATSLGMSTVDGQVLADLKRGQVGDFLTPGSVVLTPISVSTLGSQALSLTGTGGGQENVIDLRSGLTALMPLLGSDANASTTTILGSNGGDLANLAAGDATTATLSGGVLTIGTSLGGTNGALDINTADGSGQYLVGGTSQTSFGAGSVLDLTQGQLGIGKNYGANNLFSGYALGANGGLLGGSPTLSVAPSDNPGSLLAQQGLDANSLLSAANTGVGLDTPSGPAVNSLITNISVSDLGTLPQGQLPFTTDPTGSVADGMLLGGTYSDFQVIDPTVNDNGLFSNSPASILSGGWRPGNQNLLEPSQNLPQLIGGEVAASPATGGFETNITVPAAFTDYSGQSNSYLNIDPLVLDLTGKGISLSNWIDNSVYFQSNVSFNPTTNQAVSDGKLHHTSWVNPGDGILVLPVSGAVPDITDTLSEYFHGGQYNATTGQYTPWTDGLAALASLATSGATVFSAATSLNDPATGQSYWSELQVWQDTNQNGTADPGELQSLGVLGITSIIRLGCGNTLIGRVAFPQAHPARILEW